MTSEVIQVTRTGLPATPSVLGTRRFALQSGGKIRPGIKVLTKAATKIARAREIFEDGRAAGDSFDTIENRIKEAVPSLDNPLTPRNVPYFTARRGDFTVPEVAAQIMEKFGEDLGDGEKRLYRLPIVFAADSLLDVMPHKLAVYGGASIKFWSDFSGDGSERRCMTFAGVPKRSDGKAVRLFGGRKQIPRPDTDGRCDPETCPEYQNRQCNVTGRLIFYIPGIVSVSPFELPTTSIYGLDSIRATLDAIASMRGGRISGFLQNREAFWLTKTLKEVPHIDDLGRAVRVKQWIIGLEVMVDATRLLGATEEVLSAGERAADILQGTAERVIDGGETDRDDARSGPSGGYGGEDEDRAEVAERTEQPMPPSGPKASESAARPSQPPRREPGAAPAPCTQASAPAASRSTPAGATSGGSDGIPLAEVDNTAKAIGIDPETFRKYAEKRWGQGWSKNPNGRRKAIEELECFRTDPDALRQRMNAETQVFA